MANANQYFLLADHIKLSLLERQRAVSLNLEPTSQDGHISRSLDSLRDGLESISKERIRLQEAGDTACASPTDGIRLKLTRGQSVNYARRHRAESANAIQRPGGAVPRQTHRLSSLHSPASQRPITRSRLCSRLRTPRCSVLLIPPQEIPPQLLRRAGSLVFQIRPLHRRPTSAR